MMMNMTKYYSCSDDDRVLLNSCIADTHIPYYDNNAIKNVVRVLDVAKRAIYQQFQEHLQGKQTGKDNITDLQCIGQLIRLRHMENKRTRRAGSQKYSSFGTNALHL